MIGDEALLKEILSGSVLPFDRCIASQDVISELRPVARVLG